VNFGETVSYTYAQSLRKIISTKQHGVISKETSFVINRGINEVE